MKKLILLQFCATQTASTHFHLHAMALKPLKILKKGLLKLKQTVKKKKDKLNAKLTQKEPISASDEEWLDNEGNLINQQCVLDNLEAASDYEWGLERLGEEEKKLVWDLIKLGDDLPLNTGGNKCKCMLFFTCCNE